MIKSLIIFSLSFFTIISQSSALNGEVSTGGFLGQVGLGLGWRPSKKWRFQIGAGFTPGLKQDFYQLHGGVSFSPFPTTTFVDWNPLFFGVMGAYSLNDGYFIQAPSQYPHKDYYPPTALHALFQIGTELKTGDWNWRYFVSVPDIYLLAKYNNRSWNSKYCCSSGFALSF